MGSGAVPREEIEFVYYRLLDAWNRRDADGMAELFTSDGHVIGFDGSEMHGRVDIAAMLAAIFRSHPTGSYVWRIRDVTFHSSNMAILRAHVGMMPPGAADLNAALNAVQVIVAVGGTGHWRIQLLQNTPAAYHGRPDAAARLTEELRAEVRPRVG